MCIILNGYVEMLYHIMTMGQIIETSQFPSQKMPLSYVYLNRIDQLAGGKKLLGIQCGVDIRRVIPNGCHELVVCGMDGEQSLLPSKLYYEFEFVSYILEYE
jgi:hypothetical protein